LIGSVQITSLSRRKNKSGRITQCINWLAKDAGCRVAAEPGDGIFVNRRWLTIHAVTDGEKTITLAGPSRVVDFTTGKEILKETQTVVVSMKRGETRWFSLTPAVQKNEIHH
jgi:hypothetical protein